MNRRRLLLGTAAIAGGMIARPAIAQAETEISFFYPVAVGGPITKIIDGFAADFEKENPRFKLKPIYAGTYQETIAKALTAHKSGTAPVTSVLLSTDMFSLIDEDAVVPFDDFARGESDRKWLESFFPAFMANSQTAGKTWGIPFQRSTIVLYWNKEAFREAGLDPELPPADWAQQASFAEKLTKRDGSGNVTQWGLQIPSSGFPYWLFQALAIENGEELMNRQGDQTFFANPADAEGFLRAQDRDDVDHHRQSHQRARQCQIPVRGGDAAGRQAARQPDRRRQFLRLQEERARAAASRVPLHPVDQFAGTGRPKGHRYRLCGGAP